MVWVVWLRRAVGRHGRFENFRIGPSLSNRIESNRNGRFEFESNLEASQVPNSLFGHFCCSMYCLATTHSENRTTVSETALNSLVTWPWLFQFQTPEAAFWLLGCAAIQYTSYAVRSAFLATATLLVFTHLSPDTQCVGYSVSIFLIKTIARSTLELNIRWIKYDWLKYSRMVSGHKFFHVEITTAILW